MKKLQALLVFVCLMLIFHNLQAQQGTLKGRVVNRINNEAVPFANIIIDSLFTGVNSDVDGYYTIDNIPAGTYTVRCSSIGFQDASFYDVIIPSIKPAVLDIELLAVAEQLATVTVSSSLFASTAESPLSLKTISANEIYRNPGGNRDISRVIQIMPGVASSVSFRNDLIVRGGAPSENRFYLDGIEVPNINHFATQGSSGGPVGMINVNFIREVDFLAASFPANRGNAMSSILEFKQLNGNDERLTGTFTLGSSDVGLTLDGPLGKKSTFIFSARRSYLQFLFKALSLPFLPTYNDFQYKQHIKINNKNQLSIIGLGAIDDFELNKEANDSVDDQSTIDRNNYILSNLPVNDQWNYTIGAHWKHFSKNSYQNIVVSRNHLKNKSIKYKDNIVTPEALLLDYASAEIENKLRLEHTYRQNGWKWNMGLAYEYATYTNSTFSKTTLNNQVQTIDFDSELNMHKLGLFTQISKAFLNERLGFSFGIRTDINDYSDEMNKPLDQLSPRLSLSYQLSEQWRINTHIGRYYQLPAYTVLGYRDNMGTLLNKDNAVKYIQADHFVGGLDYQLNAHTKLSLEGFLKQYEQYPFLLSDSISLANLGADFGVIGNDEVTSSSSGKAFGLEFLAQQKLSSSIYGILSYTFVRSEFKDKNDNFQDASWDNRHILNLTMAKKFKNNWEVGIKFRFLGGAPYTPYALAPSAVKAIWDVRQNPLLDWNRLNSERNPSTHNLDIRVDKKWYWKKLALNAYFDIQNVYGYKTKLQDYVDVLRDENGEPVEDPNNPEAYQLFNIENTSGTVLPSVGLMLEF